MDDIKKLVAAHKDAYVRTRRDLHRIPEPAFTEKKTSTYVEVFFSVNAGSGMRCRSRRVRTYASL